MVNYGQFFGSMQVLIECASGSVDVMNVQKRASSSYEMFNALHHKSNVSRPSLSSAKKKDRNHEHISMPFPARFVPVLPTVWSVL